MGRRYDSDIAAGGAAVIPAYGRARSLRSTARATSTRDDAPSLAKMLRRCVSTVFSLRKSSAATSRLVFRAVINAATSRSRRDSDWRPPSAAPDGPRGSVRAPSRRSCRRASLRSRSAPRPSNSRSARRSRSTARSRSPPAASALAADDARALRLNRRAGLVGGVRRPERQSGGFGVALRQQDCSAGPRGHRGRERESERRGVGLGRLRAGDRGLEPAGIELQRVSAAW